MTDYRDLDALTAVTDTCPKHYWIALKFPGWWWLVDERPVPWWRRLIWRIVLGGEWKRVAP